MISRGVLLGRFDTDHHDGKVTESDSSSDDFDAHYGNQSLTITQGL